MILNLTSDSIFLIFGFLGYVIGRWGDNHLNFLMRDPWWTPHHLIFGFLLMIISFYFFHEFWLQIFSFGLGLFVSDLKDFLHFRILGSDKKIKENVKFWHID